MPKKSTTKQASGGARLKASGRVPVLLGLLPDQAETIRAAAAADGRPVTQFLVHYGLETAKRILRKSTN